MLTLSRGICHFGRQLFTALPTFNAESAVGGGDGGRGSQADSSLSGPEFKKERQKKKPPKQLSTTHRVIVVSLATEQQSGTLLQPPSWAEKHQDSGGWRVFSILLWHLEEDLFLSHPIATFLLSIGFLAAIHNVQTNVLSWESQSQKFPW